MSVYKKTIEPILRQDDIWIEQFKTDIDTVFSEIQIIVQLANSSEIIKKLCEDNGLVYICNKYSYGFHFIINKEV